MFKHFLIISFSFFFLSSFSQNEVKQQQPNVQDSQKENEELSQKWNKALGSFQFQIINSRINPQVPISTITLIEANRLQDKVNYVDYKENMRIMILPKSQISKDYQKLELFKYISTN